MNIQIFGTKKCNDTKKAERFFKERGIKYQFIDMKEKGMSKGELTSVAQANGGIDAMLDPNCKDQDTLALIRRFWPYSLMCFRRMQEPRDAMRGLDLPKGIILLTHSSIKTSLGADVI